jgi:hypothetical protein
MNPSSLRRLIWPALPVVRWAVPSRRARAKPAIVAGLILTIVANIGLSIAVERHRPQWRDPEYFHRQKQLQALHRWNRNQSHSRPLVVVIGSSRTQMGFSAEHAAQGFGAGAPALYNLSQSGSQPLGQLVNFRRMIDAGVVPDRVLIEVLPAALGVRGPLDHQIPVSRLGWSDLTRAERYFDQPGEVRFHWLQTRVVPWYSLRVDLLAHAKLADWTPESRRQDFLWNPLRPDGWMPYHLPDWTANASERLVARSGPQLRELFGHYEIHPGVAAAQRELLTECRNHGIAAALLVMPESPAFRALYSVNAQELLYRHIDELHMEFGIPLFDCRAWIADEAWFWDGNHLEGSGAERFSRRFGAECLRPWLERR